MSAGIIMGNRWPHNSRQGRSVCRKFSTLLLLLPSTTWKGLQPGIKRLSHADMELFVIPSTVATSRKFNILGFSTQRKQKTFRESFPWSNNTIPRRPIVIDHLFGYIRAPSPPFMQIYWLYIELGIWIIMRTVTQCQILGGFMVYLASCSVHACVPFVPPIAMAIASGTN